MNPPLTPILAHLRQEPSRTWSLIITVYGDCIVPRGGAVWLGTLLAFFQALGIGDGVVRTAMSRLTADGWLERSRAGRNSFYRLRSKGLAIFEAAGRRIYTAQPEPWQGHFELLLPDSADRAALEAAGCGALAPGVWLSPRPLAMTGLRLQAGGDADALRGLAARAWKLDQLAQPYALFVTRFTPLRQFLAEGGVCEPIEALAARVLLIHEYRRIVLRDPLLPPEVLPPGWPGEAAREMCAMIYRALLPASETWLDRHATGEAGSPLPANPLISKRFTR